MELYHNNLTIKEINPSKANTFSYLYKCIFMEILILFILTSISNQLYYNNFFISSNCHSLSIVTASILSDVINPIVFTA